jgi:hypothetical protein
MNNKYSFLLFAQPSFAEGFGRLWDFGNFLTEYNYTPTGDLADYVALRSDTMAVAHELENSFNSKHLFHPLAGEGVQEELAFPEYRQ